MIFCRNCNQHVGYCRGCATECPICGEDLRSAPPIPMYDPDPIQAECDEDSYEIGPWIVSKKVQR